MKLWTALTVVLVVLSGCAASPAEPKASPSPRASAEVDAGRGTECLEGAVFDDEMVPLSQAQAGLVEAQLTATTGEDGLFQICGLDAGTYTLHVSRLGYFEVSQRVQVPREGGRLQITLVAIPILEPYALTVPKTIYYLFGLSTLDTTTSRFVANVTNCGPCTWNIHAPGLPDYIVWEAKWNRNPTPAAGSDLMYYLLRGGIPFEAGTDVGSGNPSLPQPWRVDITKEKLLTNANVKAAAQKKGEIPLSGSMYCWGSPAWPCVDQRIEMWLSFLYDHDEATMANFTALPKSS